MSVTPTSPKPKPGFPCRDHGSCVPPPIPGIGDSSPPSPEQGGDLDRGSGAAHRASGSCDPISTPIRCPHLMYPCMYPMPMYPSPTSQLHGVRLGAALPCDSLPSCTCCLQVPRCP